MKCEIINNSHIYKIWKLKSIDINITFGLSKFKTQ